MVWAATAVAAVGVGVQAYNAKKAGKAADRSAQMAYEAEQAQLEFEKQRHTEWKQTYGDIEQNLAQHYTNLSPTIRVVQGLEAFELEKDAALTELRENLAQRGLATSGLAAAVETDFAISSAEERARIRAEAPMETAKEQLSFLQVGLGQNPANNVSAALGSRASRANNTAMATAQASGQATQNFQQGALNLAGDLADIFANRDK